MSTLHWCITGWSSHPGAWVLPIPAKQTNKWKKDTTALTIWECFVHFIMYVNFPCKDVVLRSGQRSKITLPGGICWDLLLPHDGFISIPVTKHTKINKSNSNKCCELFMRQKYWCITGGLTPGMRSHTVYFTYQQYETTTTTALWEFAMYVSCKLSTCKGCPVGGWYNSFYA